jgi:hypothetical protein
MKLNRFLKILTISTAIFIGQGASAQVIDSSFYQWRVYEIGEDGEDEKKCYILAHPTKSNTDHGNRQNPYIVITRFQKDRSEEFSVFAGYEFKNNSEVFVLSDEHQFKLLAKEDFAWMKTRGEDAQIIQTMLKSGMVKVRSDSAFGTYAVDEYSLKGITRAYARMREICK